MMNYEFLPEELRHPGGRSLTPQEGFRAAPVFIILLGDPRTIETYILTAVYHHGQANFYSGLANAFLYMHLAAASLGLGSQWLTSTASPYVQTMLKSLLGIPGPLVIYDTMVVGYRAYEPKPRLRRTRAEVVHSERYDKAKFRTDEEVRNFIARVHKDRIEARA